MQSVALGVEEHVNHREAKGYTTHQETLHCLIEGECFSILAFNPYSPGTHAQGLTTVSPEPVKEQKCDQ